MKILISHLRQNGDAVLSSVIYKLFKEKYPGCEIKLITGNYIIQELLRHNPYLDSIQVIESPYEADEVFESERHKYDDAIRLLYWSNRGLSSWENSIMKSFVVSSGFTEKEAEGCCPKIYWTDEDLEKINKLMSKLEINLKSLVVGTLDEDMFKYQETVRSWSIRNDLRFLRANIDFARRFNLNFREIGCLAANSLFAVGQEGGWLHVAACAGAKTVGFPRRINPLCAMPEYYHNKFRDQRMRHLSVHPPAEKQCGRYSSVIEQRPCNYLLNGDSSNIVHEDERSCFPKSFKCEETITEESINGVLDLAISDLRQ